MILILKIINLDYNFSFNDINSINKTNLLIKFKLEIQFLYRDEQFILNSIKNSLNSTFSSYINIINKPEICADEFDKCPYINDTQINEFYDMNNYNILFKWNCINATNETNLNDFSNCINDGIVYCDTGGAFEVEIIIKLNISYIPTGYCLFYAHYDLLQEFKKSLKLIGQEGGGCGYGNFNKFYTSEYNRKFISI